jgi:hypothetical protein
MQDCLGTVVKPKLYESRKTMTKQEEWSSLTPQEQSAEWDSFHEANAIGNADDLYFYDILMACYLIDYVGH